MSTDHEAVGDRTRYAQGRGKFVGDVRLPDQVSLAVVRSYLPHADIVGVETAEARDMPGVLAAWTAADIIADLRRLPLIRPRISDDPVVAPYLQSVLAEDRVRYVGEPVAIVVARTRHLAEDAAELVSVDLAARAVVTNLEEAERQPELFAPGNLISTAVSEFGDPDSAFAAAPVIVELDVATSRHSGMPMETRGIVAAPGDDGRITLWGAAKVPHANRAALAEMLGIPADRIRMLETDVGGGFGIRGEFYPEDFLAAWAAMQLGLPVSWIEDRSEHMVAANQSRGQLHRAAICSTEDGRLLGLRSEFWLDAGAYVRTVGVRVADLTLGELPGPYRIPSYRGVAHSVVTNRVPTGTYRSPGRFESSFVRERLLDALAERLGLDGRVLRRQNLVRPEDMPFRSGLISAGKQVSFAEGDFPGLFDQVCEAADQRETEVRMAVPVTSNRRIGVGVGSFIEKSGLGPFEEASIEVDGGGRVSVRTGATFFGQGLHRALAHVVSEQLQVGVTDIRVLKVDTDLIPRGIGTYASRGMVMAGSAALAACADLLSRARLAASVVLETAPNELVFGRGGFHATGPRSGSVSLAQLARHSETGSLQGHGRHEAEHVSFGFGTHAAVCSVDPATGIARVEALVLGYDAGRVIVPDIVEAQLQGAATQALGGALLECFAYDDAGTPLATTLMDYLMPTASEAPHMTVILGTSITADNPLGVRGVGEAGIPGIAAAVARAIESACGSAPALFTTPFRPSDIWEKCLDRAPDGAWLSVGQSGFGVESGTAS